MTILLVDDHPMTVESYRLALSRDGSGGQQDTFHSAYSCQEAVKIIESCAKLGVAIDIAILDYGLPPYGEAKINNGGDLCLLLRKRIPAARVLLLTAHTEVLVIYEMAKKIRPDGLAIKNDVTPANLPAYVADSLEGNFQSPSVKACVLAIWKKEMMVEDYNRQILIYLSKGFKIKEIEQIIHLSSSAIQKRIHNMKRVFEVADDGSLVREALKQNFI